MTCNKDYNRLPLKKLLEVRGNFEVIFKFIFHPKQRSEKGFSGPGQRSDGSHCRNTSLPSIRCLTAPSKADGLFLGICPVLLVKATGNFTFIVLNAAVCSLLMSFAILTSPQTPLEHQPSFTAKHTV